MLSDAVVLGVGVPLLEADVPGIALDVDVEDTDAVGLALADAEGEGEATSTSNVGAGTSANKEVVLVLAFVSRQASKTIKVSAKTSSARVVFNHRL